MSVFEWCRRSLDKSIQLKIIFTGDKWFLVHFVSTFSMLRLFTFIYLSFCSFFATRLLLVLSIFHNSSPALSLSPFYWFSSILIPFIGWFQGFSSYTYYMRPKHSSTKIDKPKYSLSHFFAIDKNILDCVRFLYAVFFSPYLVINQVAAYFSMWVCEKKVYQILDMWGLMIKFTPQLYHSISFLRFARPFLFFLFFDSLCCWLFFYF